MKMLQSTAPCKGVDRRVADDVVPRGQPALDPEVGCIKEVMPALGLGDQPLPLWWTTDFILASPEGTPTEEEQWIVLTPPSIKF